MNTIDNTLAFAAIASLLNDLVEIRIPNPGYRQWPFISVEALRERLDSNEHAARLAFMLTYTLQTADEIASKETTNKNRRGFMGSHALPSTGIGSQVVMAFEQALMDGQEPVVAFTTAWEGILAVPTDKDNRPLTVLKADGGRWTPDQEGLRDYARHVGTRYSRATLQAVRDHLMNEDDALRAAARVISPNV